MPQLKLPLLKGDAQTDLDYRDLLPVNMIPVSRNVKGDTGYLLTHDGLKEFAQVSGKARGGFFNERFRKHFRVSGQRLEEIGTDGTVTVIGTIPGNDVCKFAASFNTQAILSEGRLFLYDNATLKEVTDPDLGLPIDITWFRGVYVLTDGATVFQTDILDEYSINPTKFVTSEFSNDPTVAVRQTNNNQIIAFNRTSIEFFFFNPNAGAGASVLSPVQGKANKVGAVSSSAITEMSGIYFCVGSRENESHKLYAINGTGLEQTVSTRHVEQILGDYTQAQLKRIYIESRYKDNQHILLVHLEDCTLLYNHTIAQKYGIELAWSIVKTGVEGAAPWRAKYGVFDVRINKWIYGDLQENKLGELSSDTAAQYGEQVETEFYTPVVYIGGNAVVQDIELQNIPGYSVTDASLFYSFTDDGQTYGQESTFNVSKDLEYKRSIKIRNNGLFKELLGIKMRVVSKYKQAFNNLTVNYRSRGTS